VAEKFPLFTETLETPPEELAAGSTFAGLFIPPFFDVGDFLRP
jgi:hypothetical protein